MLPKSGHNAAVTTCEPPFEKHKPLTTIDFEQQLDYFSEWTNEWGTTERFVFIEKLLSKCDVEQIQLLWTVLQPTLHRDFLFSSLSTETNTGFSPISIPTTREIHRNARLSKPKGKRVPFLKSAVLRNEEDVHKWASCSVLPIMKSPMPTSFTRLSYRGSPEAASGSWKCQQNYFGVRFPGIKKPHSRSVLSIKSAPPKLGCYQIKQQISRRHMQKNQNEQERSKNIYKTKENTAGNQRDISDSWELKNEVSKFPTTNKSQDRFKSNQMVNQETKMVLKWFDCHWNDWKKNEFLQIFLKMLDPSELFFLSGLMVVRQYRDFITLLPRKLSRNVFSFLKVRELALVCQVSRGWNSMANDEELWKNKCKEIYIGIPLCETKHWKTVYKESLELQNNWDQGLFSSVELCGHTKRVLVVTAFENLIASGSFDKTIKIWDAKSGNLIQTLEGHTKGVWSLCFVSNTILVSGSHDTTIKVWNLRTSNCVKILMSHTGPVWAMERKLDTLLTGSGDKTAKVWNIRRCQLVHTLIGHSASVFCVDIDHFSNRAFTGSADHSVRIWNLENGECLKYFYVGAADSANAVTSLSYDQGILATATGNGILVWNIETKKCIKELPGHDDRVEAVKLKLKTVRGACERTFVYSTGKDGFVKYWDLDEGECLKSFRGHVGSVNTLFVDDIRIIFGSDDSKIRVWNFLPRGTTRQKRAGKIRNVNK